MNENTIIVPPEEQVENDRDAGSHKTPKLNASNSCEDRKSTRLNSSHP